MLGCLIDFNDALVLNLFEFLMVGCLIGFNDAWV